MTTPASYGVAAQIDAMYDKLEAGGMGRAFIVGDSIAFRPAWHSYLRSEMGIDFGVAGYGYRGINPDFKYLDAQGVPEIKIAFAGLGSNLVKAKGTTKRDQTWGIYEPDGIFTRMRSDGSVTLTIPAGLTVKLHYLRQPDGGTLAVDKSGVRIQTIDTNGSIGNVIVSLTSGTKYKLYSTSAAWVQVNALETTKSVGFVMDRLARGQDNPHGYNTGDTPSSSSAITALAPDLILIQTDWYVPNQSKASFIADMNAYIAFVRAAVPGVGIVLIAHHAMSADSQDVSDTLYAIAQDVGCGFIDHLQVMTYTDMVANNYIQTDGTHLTNAGGSFFAHCDAELFRSTR